MLKKPDYPLYLKLLWYILVKALHPQAANLVLAISLPSRETIEVQKSKLFPNGSIYSSFIHLNLISVLGKLPKI